MTCENSVVTSNLYTKSSHLLFFKTSKSLFSRILLIKLPQTSSLSHESLKQPQQCGVSLFTIQV